MEKRDILGLLKIVFIIPVLILFVGFTQSNGTSSETILWSEANTIDWKKFKAKASLIPGAHALTASAIESSYSCESSHGLIKYQVRAVFMPDRSWVKADGRTDYLLKHELLHFDITELHARKFRKELSERQIKCNERKEFDKVASQINNEWIAMQALYDKETNHSINQEAQKLWEDKVSQELLSLKKYIFY